MEIVGIIILVFVIVISLILLINKKKIRNPFFQDGRYSPNPLHAIRIDFIENKTKSKTKHKKTEYV